MSVPIKGGAGAGTSQQGSLKRPFRISHSSRNMPLVALISTKVHVKVEPSNFMSQITSFTEPVLPLLRLRPPKSGKQALEICLIKSGITW